MAKALLGYMNSTDPRVVSRLSCGEPPPPRSGSPTSRRSSSGSRRENDAWLAAAHDEQLLTLEHA